LREEKPSKNYRIAILLMMTLEYWGHVIPGDLKDRAVNDVVEDYMILGTR
jgi:hypothetical protein